MYLYSNGITQGSFNISLHNLSLEWIIDIQTQNSNLRLSLYIHIGLCKHIEKELPWSVMLNEIYSGNTWFCRPKTILEYSRLTTETRNWTNAVAKRSLYVAHHCTKLPTNYILIANKNWDRFEHLSGWFLIGSLFEEMKIQFFTSKFWTVCFHLIIGLGLFLKLYVAK